MKLGLTRGTIDEDRAVRHADVHRCHPERLEMHRSWPVWGSGVGGYISPASS